MAGLIRPPTAPVGLASFASCRARRCPLRGEISAQSLKTVHVASHGRVLPLRPLLWSRALVALFLSSCVRVSRKIVSCERRTELQMRGTSTIGFVASGLRLVAFSCWRFLIGQLLHLIWRCFSAWRFNFAVVSALITPRTVHGTA